MPFKKRVLFFDIETSPNIVASWGASWKERLSPDNIIHERKIICISWKWLGDETVYNAHWDNKKDDKKMLKLFIKALHHSDIAIAHNIRKFDLPWIRTRALYHGIILRPDTVIIDTLTWAKNYFRFNSNRLDYISKFLGSEGKIKTHYGMWMDLLIRPYKDKVAKETLKDMIFYCDKDVEELEVVYKRLAPYMKHKIHFGVLNGGEKWECPDCGSDNVRVKKTKVTAAGTSSKQMHCKDCNRYYFISMRAHKQYEETKRLEKMSL